MLFAFFAMSDRTGFYSSSKVFGWSDRDHHCRALSVNNSTTLTPRVTALLCRCLAFRFVPAAEWVCQNASPPFRLGSCIILSPKDSFQPLRAQPGRRHLVAGRSETGITIMTFRSQMATQACDIRRAASHSVCPLRRFSNRANSLSTKRLRLSGVLSLTPPLPLSGFFLPRPDTAVCGFERFCPAASCDPGSGTFLRLTIP